LIKGIIRRLTPNESDRKMLDRFFSGGGLNRQKSFFESVERISHAIADELDILTDSSAVVVIHVDGGPGQTMLATPALAMRLIHEKTHRLASKEEALAWRWE
jgi:hypothetical protein